MKRIVEFVDPQIGVDRGNCLIGPYRPFSLVRLGPDCEIPHKTTTGYCSDSPVIGFSHTHVSGTGGVSLRLSPRLDNILLKDWCKSL